MTTAMDALKQILTYAALIGLAWLVMWLTPQCSRVHASTDYDDIEGLQSTASYRLDSTVTVGRLGRGDPVCWRLGTDSDRQVQFGWVAGLPGDDVAVVKGELRVNGKECAHGQKTQLIDSPPVRVPRDHVYVVSGYHRYDSIVNGPLPAVAIRGRVPGDFP